MQRLHLTGERGRLPYGITAGLEAQNEKEGCLGTPKAVTFSPSSPLLLLFLGMPAEAVMVTIISGVVVGLIVIAMVWSEEKKLHKEGKGSRFAALWRNEPD